MKAYILTQTTLAMLKPDSALGEPSVCEEPSSLIDLRNYVLNSKPIPTPHVARGSKKKKNKNGKALYIRCDEDDDLYAAYSMLDPKSFDPPSLCSP